MSDWVFGFSSLILAKNGVIGVDILHTKCDED